MVETVATRVNGQATLWPPLLFVSLFLSNRGHYKLFNSSLILCTVCDSS